MTEREYKIERRSNPAESYETMVVVECATRQALAEYRLTAGMEWAEIDALRIQIDEHLAQPGKTLGNYAW